MPKKTTTQIAELQKSVPGQEKKLNDLLKAAEADAKTIIDLTVKLKERDGVIKNKDAEISALKKEKGGLETKLLSTEKKLITTQTELATLKGKPAPIIKPVPVPPPPAPQVVKADDQKDAFIFKSV